MKSIIFLNIFAIAIINPIVAHEDHDHQIYNWSNSENETIKTDPISNDEKLEDKNKETKINIKNI